jgi:hypothetical protein
MYVSKHSQQGCQPFSLSLSLSLSSQATRRENKTKRSCYTPPYHAAKPSSQPEPPTQNETSLRGLRTERVFGLADPPSPPPISTRLTTPLLSTVNKEKSSRPRPTPDVLPSPHPARALSPITRLSLLFADPGHPRATGGGDPRRGLVEASRLCQGGSLAWHPLHFPSRIGESAAHDKGKDIDTSFCAASTDHVGELAQAHLSSRLAVWSVDSQESFPEEA